MNSYVELVSRRLEDRNSHIVSKLDEMQDVITSYSIHYTKLYEGPR